MAADQQPVMSGLGSQGDQRPVVVALSLNTRACREPLLGTLGQAGGQRVGPHRSGCGGHPPVAADGQHLTHLARLQIGAQPGSAP